MKITISFFTLIILQTAMTLFDFNTKSNITNWRIVDDVVMGGRSTSSFAINKDGFGVFEGTVSLENNGGFSMVQHTFNTKEVDNYTKVSITLKGDGKSYQFRIKTNASDNYAYIASFDTNTEWQTIEIPFNKMYPTFRGRKLNIGNYPGQKMELIAFLIGNKKAEAFKLEVDRIVLK